MMIVELLKVTIIVLPPTMSIGVHYESDTHDFKVQTLFSLILFCFSIFSHVEKVTLFSTVVHKNTLLGIKSVEESMEGSFEFNLRNDSSLHSSYPLHYLLFISSRIETGRYGRRSIEWTKTYCEWTSGNR